MLWVSNPIFLSVNSCLPFDVCIHLPRFLILWEGTFWRLIKKRFQILRTPPTPWQTLRTVSFCTLTFINKKSKFRKDLYNTWIKFIMYLVCGWFGVAFCNSQIFFFFVRKTVLLDHQFRCDTTYSERWLKSRKRCDLKEITFNTYLGWLGKKVTPNRYSADWWLVNVGQKNYLSWQLQVIC